jgi:hypothetical protein
MDSNFHKPYEVEATQWNGDNYDEDEFNKLYIAGHNRASAENIVVEVFNNIFE